MYNEFSKRQLRNIIRPPSVRGDKEMCEHIAKMIEIEREQRKLVDMYRNKNRLELLKVLQKRHEATRELEKKAGIQRPSNKDRPYTTINTQTLQNNTNSFLQQATDNLQQPALNTQTSQPTFSPLEIQSNHQRCSTRFSESKVIEKLKAPIPVLLYIHNNK